MCVVRRLVVFVMFLLVSSLEARFPFGCQSRRQGFRFGYRPVFRAERYVPYMCDGASDPCPNA